MRAVLKVHRETSRTVWVADSFKGLPAPNASRYTRHELLDYQVKFLVGWFKDTLLPALIGRIALMGLDCDIYESTTQSFEALYHKSSVGGHRIIDAMPEGLKTRIEWLVPSRNLGYGDASNFAIADRRRSSYVLLKTGLVTPRPTFDGCLAILDQDGVGVVGPVLGREGGSLQPGAARLARWRQRPPVLFDLGPRVVERLWVTAAAMFIKGEVATDVGLDGPYFLGAEDADLCIRANRSVSRRVCCGEVSAQHVGSQESRTGLRSTYYTTRNRVWWTRLNFGTNTAIVNWFGALFGLPHITLADILRRRDRRWSRPLLLGLRHAAPAQTGPSAWIARR